MLTHLKCYLSASYEVNVALIDQVLQENQVEVYEFYDGSIGNSFQDILKRKLRQVDFAIFIVTKNNNNIIYEIGVCEGLGKQSLIIIDKDVEVPFYLENKLALNANLEDKNVLEFAIKAFISELPIKGKKKNPEKPQPLRMATESYDENLKEIFTSLLLQTRNLRVAGHAVEMEHIVEELLKSLRMKYVQNMRTNDAGIDFALWNDKLGRVLGNPIIIECKFGRLDTARIEAVTHQLKVYSEKSDSSVAILLYLDKEGKRFNLEPSMKPLIIAFDLEDFLEALIFETFESLILARRNLTAHKNLK